MCAVLFNSINRTVLLSYFSTTKSARWIWHSSWHRAIPLCSSLASAGGPLAASSPNLSFGQKWFSGRKVTSQVDARKVTARVACWFMKSSANHWQLGLQPKKLFQIVAQLSGRAASPATQSSDSRPERGLGSKPTMLDAHCVPVIGCVRECVAVSLPAASGSMEAL